MLISEEGAGKRVYFYSGVAHQRQGEPEGFSGLVVAGDAATAYTRVLNRMEGSYFYGEHPTKVDINQFNYVEGYDADK